MVKLTYSGQNVPSQGPTNSLAEQNHAPTRKRGQSGGLHDQHVYSVLRRRRHVRSI
jgi:hypothetical protein